jgi:hypothetical protein
MPEKLYFDLQMIQPLDEANFQVLKVGTVEFAHLLR